MKTAEKKMAVMRTAEKKTSVMKRTSGAEEAEGTKANIMV